jgi:hypothetical protein
MISATIGNPPRASNAIGQHAKSSASGNYLSLSGRAVWLVVGPLICSPHCQTFAVIVLS